MSFPKVLQQSNKSGHDVGRDAATSSSSTSVVPARQVWTLKHFSLLLVLNVAILGLGLLIHQMKLSNESSPEAIQDVIPVIGHMPPALTAFLWMAFLQGSLNYWVFRDLFRAFAHQHRQLADSMRTSASRRTAMDEFTPTAIPLGKL